MIPEDEQMPDLGQLMLTAKSSIRQPQVPLGQIVAQQVFTAQQYKKQGKQFLNQYEVLGFLGQGAYGKVKKVQRSYLENDGTTVTKSIYAMKIYDRNVLAKIRFFGPDLEMINGLQVLQNQLNITKTLDHKNVLRCYQIIDDLDNDKVFLIIDFCDLGQIMEYDTLTEGYYRNKKLMKYIKQTYDIKTQNIEDYAKIIFYQLAQGVLYLHSRNITHRDIKADNVMIRTGIVGEQVKLGDFTTARYSQDDISNQTIGTVNYKSPQQQFATQNGYSAKAADIWSFAITLYLFCFQKFPFNGESQLEIDIKSLNDPILYPQTASQKLINLIQKMTVKQFNNRPSISEVMSHEWFK